MKKVLLIMSLMMCALVVFADSITDSLILKLGIKGFTTAAWVNADVNLSDIKDLTDWEEIANDTNFPGEHDMVFGTSYTVKAVAFTNKKSAITMTVSGGPLTATDAGDSKIALSVKGESIDDPIVWDANNSNSTLTWTEDSGVSGARVFERDVTFTIDKTSYYKANASEQGYSSTVVLTVTPV